MFIVRAIFGPSAAEIRRNRQRAEEAARRRREEAARQKREHDLKMAKLKQEQANAAFWRKETKTTETEIITEKATGKKLAKDVPTAQEEEKELKKKLDSEETKCAENLAIIQKDVEKAQAEFKLNNDRIRDAINKTDVDEGSIPQFLNLINDGLLVGTLNDTAKREELNAKIGAFGDLIARRTTTSMELDTFFNTGALSKCAKYLKAEEYVQMDDILCDKEDEFQEIVGIVESGIEAENKEIEEYNANLDSVNADIRKNNTAIQKKVDVIDADIAEIQKVINALKEELCGFTGKDEKEEKSKEQIEKESQLSGKEKLKSEKQQQKQDEMANMKPEQKEQEPISALTAKAKKGGPVFEKLKKLCMRDIAEGKRGWITKQVDVDPEDVDPATLFKGKLAPFAGYLKEQDYEDMDSILCEEPEDFDTILEIIEEGIKANGGKPLKKGTIGKKSAAFRRLYNMCMRDKAKEGWITQQAQKKEIVEAQLTEVSPLLALFFGEMDKAVTDARKVLEYNTEYNAEQMQAIQDAPKNEEALKAIKLKSEEEEETKSEANDDSKKSEQRQNNVLEEFNAGCDGTLSNIPKDMDPKQSDALQKARKENTAFMSAAIVKLHVVDTLAPQFKNSKLPETQKTGLTLAKDVENCSLEIMRSQATIRSSILIARQLVEFKPPSPGPKAAPLWNVIDDGIINIFNNYIEMIKIAATYFAFFVKFKSSFEHYLSCHEVSKGKVDLLVATEYLQRDVRDFTAFKKEMQVVVDKLTADAKEVITNCVKQTAGADAFNKAQEGREKAQEQLLKEQARFTKERYAVKTEYDAAHKAWKEQHAKMKQLEFEKEQSDAKITRLSAYLEQARLLSK